MSDSEWDGGAAFNGMTMRQYYKAAALQGLVADGDRHYLENTRRAAIDAANLADALLYEDAEFARKQGRAAK